MASRDAAWPCPAPGAVPPHLTCRRMGAEAGSGCPSPHWPGRCSCRQKSVGDLASPVSGAWQEGERELRSARRAHRIPSTEGTCALQVLSYLSGAVQLVRNVHELSLCFRANVAAIPFQGDAVDHHKAEAEGASGESGASRVLSSCNIIPRKWSEAATG